MEITLTSFLDYTLKSGSPKLTCAKVIKQQLNEEYDPKHDYYKRFREAVQELHKADKPKKDLEKQIGDIPPNKLANYRLMIKGYQKFWGSKSVSWFTPPRKVWNHGKLSIAINPEVGLTRDGKNYVIKLYLKADKLSKDRIASVLALLHRELYDESTDHQIALLDVRNGKLHVYESKMSELLPLIDAEADSLESILNSI